MSIPVNKLTTFSLYLGIFNLILALPSKNHVYVEGEIVRVREPWTVVAALQHCHGGWNSLMKTVRVSS